MKEYSKTLMFVVCGAVALLLAWVARPPAPQRADVVDTGEQFFADFTDPLAAASLEIIAFSEETGTAQAFNVARHDGVWSIPSHGNYPADAENQFAEATASMIGLQKGVDVSDRQTDHELYGVVDPSEAGPGASGVGKRVRIKTDDGRTLADLIIGKPVKDSQDQRFVRLPGRDRVYMAVVDPDKFSTDFEDWIEKDLLKLDPSKISEVLINDYSIDELGRRVIQGQVLRLIWNNEDRTWSLEGLTAEEELDKKAINAMKGALDDLQIIDVHRKPAGLGSELRAEDALQLDSEAVRSLQSRGYYIVDGRLLSNQGETLIRTIDGVQYTLRFGEIALTPGREDAEGDEAEDSATGTSRYLFVTAQFDESLVPPPDVMELPELPENADESMAQALETARQKIDEENSKNRKAHENKVEEGRKLARELNDRFADWYYVISDPVYQKIRLSRGDVVKPAAGTEGEPSS